MEGPPLGPGGEDITWPDQVAPRGRKASSTRKIKPQTSNLTWHPDMSNQQSLPHVNVYERSTGSRHSSCTSFSVSTPAMNLKVS